MQIYFGKLPWKGPHMTPIELIQKLKLNDIPDGIDGLISQLVTLPPLTLGLLLVIVTTWVNVMFSVA